METNFVEALSACRHDTHGSAAMSANCEAERGQ
jgi:hypothetical protein